MKPKKILYLSHYERVHDHQFLSHLVQRKEIELLCVLIHPTIPEELSGIPNLKIVQLYDHAYPIDDPNREGYSFKSRLILRYTRILYARKLKKIITTFQPDLIHSVWTQIDTAIATQTHFHPILMMPVGSDILVNPFKNPATLKDTRRIISSVDYVTCDAQMVKSKIEKICPSYPKHRFLVFPWGVDVEIFKPKERTLVIGKPRLIMTRNFYPVYNHRFFIELVLKLQKVFSDISVVLIGEGPLKKEIELYVSQLGLQNNVHFRGYLSKAELISELQMADLYVSTSISDGTSVSLLEAMSCGLTCAVTDLDSNKEWISNENGILLNIQNDKQCIDALLDLLNSPSKLKLFSQKNRQIAETKANWHQHMNQLIELYQSLTTSKDS